MQTTALFALVLLAPACASATPAPDSPDAAAPYVLVLGTAQDGGLPQIGCAREHCRLARAEPRRRRLVTSILLVDPRSSRRYLFDATPDLPEQVELAAGHPPTRSAALRPAGGRPPLFDGVFLTHAHMGHYAGLLYLGPEVYGARGLPVHASERMGAFLRENGPWSLLVETGIIELATLRPGEPVRLADDLVVTPIAVPHREELSDVLAFVIRGPRRSLLYLPDIDEWERWDRPVEELLAGVDAALVDGTFFDGGELPERDLSEIPHPFIADSIERFGALPASERAKVHFTHLNHSNPAADPASEAAARVRASGMAVATEAMRIAL